MGGPFIPLTLSLSKGERRRLGQPAAAAKLTESVPSHHCS